MISTRGRRLDLAGELPSEALRTVVGGALGSVAFEFLHQWATSRSTLWRVTGGEAEAVLKVHRSQKLFSRECEAYQWWIPSLPKARVPTLLGSFPGLEPSLLLSWIDGEMFDNAALSPAGDLSVFEQAGHFLRDLHDVSCGPKAEADSLVGVARSKILSRCDRFRESLPNEVVAWARIVADSEDWPALPVGICHRDFSPRNWTVDSHVRPPHLAVVDFENVEAYFLGDDLMKLWDVHFIGRPDRRDAFCAGYETRLEDELWQLRLMAPLHGLALMSWGVDHGSPLYFDMGRDFLCRAARNRHWMFD